MYGDFFSCGADPRCAHDDRIGNCNGLQLLGIARIEATLEIVIDNQLDCSDVILQRLSTRLVACYTAALFA